MSDAPIWKNNFVRFSILIISCFVLFYNIYNSFLSFFLHIKRDIMSWWHNIFPACRKTFLCETDSPDTGGGGAQRQKGPRALLQKKFIWSKLLQTNRKIKQFFHGNRRCPCVFLFWLKPEGIVFLRIFIYNILCCVWSVRMCDGNGVRGDYSPKRKWTIWSATGIFTANI